MRTESNASNGYLRLLAVENTATFLPARLLSLWTLSQLTALAFLLLIFARIAPAQVIYNSIPDPTPPNVVSLGYQATQTDEFGDLIQFAGTQRTLHHVTVLMSDWAPASDWPGYPGSNGPTWNHPITMNLYTVVPNANPNLDPAPGALIATRTQTFAIPWRPPTDPTCPNANTWRAGDGTCYSGFAFKIVFDFSGVVVPDQIIYGLAFNTLTWGANPIGVPGPYESLNFGLSVVGASIGSQPFPDSAYWNTHTAGNYSFDPGINSVFRKDVNWTPYSGAVTFDTISDVYQVAYAANVSIGDAYINITNAGTRGGYDFTQVGFSPAGPICANVYVFDPSEEMVACCACYVSPDGLRSLSAQNDLLTKTLTPSKPNGIVIKLLASAATNGPTSCDPTSPGNSNLESGLRAWATSLHVNTTSSTSTLTENPFTIAALSQSELQKLTTFCGFIKANGSSFGICNSCQLGGTLGGESR